MATEDITSDETFNFKCSSCVNLKRNREAVKYCVECQGYCCQECVETHTAFVALKSHTLLDKVSFKSSKRSATGLPDVPTKICSEHEIKVLDMYCENHDVVGCTTCMALEHRSCTDVQSISHSIETIFQISDAHKTFQTMQDKINALRQKKATIEANIEELSQCKEKALNAIKDFRKEMRDILDKLEKESINEAEVEFGNLESILKEQEKKMESEIEVLKKAVDDLQKSDGNKAQQFVLMKIAQKKIEGIESSCKSPEEQTTMKITFFANQKLQDFIEHVETFGKVTADPRVSLNPRTTAYSVKDKKEMSIRLESDSNNCGVQGACLTDDGMLLLADYYNSKLKRANIDKLAMVDHFDLPARPNDVCCISKQTTAVVLSDNNIQFISLGNQMTLIRQLKLEHRCFGIACKDDRLYVTEAGSSLYVHDMSGNLLQTISQNKTDGYLFKQNQDIAFSDNGDKMFVADWHNGVVTLDAKGCHIETFGGATELTNAHDVCSDGRGSLFVSGYGSHNIVQFAEDGKKSFGEVVKPSDGLVHPYCVCFYPCRNRLIVTLFPSDIVKIFDLQ